MDNVWNGEPEIRFCSAKVSAYLTIPLSSKAMTYTPRRYKTYFSMNETYDASKLSKPLDVDRKSIFRVAIKALRLDGPHTRELVEKFDYECNCLPRNGEHDRDVSTSDGNEERHLYSTQTADLESTETTDYESTETKTQTTSDVSSEDVVELVPCVECDTEGGCRGFQSEKPKLMVLTSGYLKTYGYDHFGYSSSDEEADSGPYLRPRQDSFW